MARITGREPREDAARAVYRRTEGNPLFVEALIGDGELGSGLPESLRDLLIAGVRRLPEQTQDVVRIASAGGDQVGHALLAAVTGLDDTALATALRPAVAANVLLTGSDGYAFRHTLIREAVHDELLPGERGGLHGRFARAIEGDPLLVPPGRAAVERAYHWYAAMDTAWALISAWQAAAESGRALAHAEQLAMLSRVLELWDHGADAAERIGADHVAVLEAAVRRRRAGRGVRPGGRLLPRPRCKEVDVAADPVRAALLHRVPWPPEHAGWPGRLRQGPARGGPAGPGRPAEPRPGPGCWKRRPTTSTTGKAGRRRGPGPRRGGRGRGPAGR